MGYSFSGFHRLHSARLVRLADSLPVGHCVISCGCLDLGATWTYKKKRRVPGIPGDSSLSYLYLLHHTTPRRTTVRALFYIGGTTHNSRRYETRTTKSARARTGANQSTTTTRLVDECTRARTECAHTTHVDDVYRTRLHYTTVRSASNLQARVV